MPDDDVLDDDDVGGGIELIDNDGAIPDPTRGAPVAEDRGSGGGGEAPAAAKLCGTGMVLIDHGIWGIKRNNWIN